MRAAVKETWTYICKCDASSDSRDVGERSPQYHTISYSSRIVKKTASIGTRCRVLFLFLGIGVTVVLLGRSEKSVCGLSLLYWFRGLVAQESGYQGERLF